MRSLAVRLEALGLTVRQSSYPGESAGVIRQAAEVYEHASAPGIARSRDQIARFFTGLDMIPPGLTDPCQWRNPRPPRKPRPVLFYAGVGRKPAIRRAAV